MNLSSIFPSAHFMTTYTNSSFVFIVWISRALSASIYNKLFHYAVKVFTKLHSNLHNAFTRYLSSICNFAKKPSNEHLCVQMIICDFIKTCTYLGTFYKTQKKAFKVLRCVTAKKKLERLQFSTSSSFFKILSACSCEFKAYF